jgi:Cu2+-exporting ATPase
MAIALLLLSGIGHLDQLGQLNLPGLSNLGFTNIWFHCGLATVALLVPGRSMLIDGWRGLRRNAPNMNTLVSMGTLTAYITSLIALLVPQLGWECFFDEPVMLVGLSCWVAPSNNKQEIVLPVLFNHYLPSSQRCAVDEGEE